MKIVVTPDPILVKVSEAVIKFDKKLKQTVNQMSKTLDDTRDPVGVGLAAPQVGISKRIFLSKPQEEGPTHIFINPEIVEVSQDEEIPDFSNSKKVESKKPKKSKGKLLEGCLSIPNIWGNVSRKKEITVNYQDVNGNSHTETLNGFPAIIVQHEIDHLNGILFTKHVLEQKEQLYKSHKNEQGEDEFEEIEI